MGLFLVLTKHDILIAYADDTFYCCVSTLCFYVLSVSIDFGCECLKRLPAILYSVWTKRPRKEKKVMNGIIYQDAVIGYYAICVGMTLWLQYNLFDWREAGFILLCWFGLCAFFRFLRITGKREIKR